MVRWDPWRGCHKYSDGCTHCYIHKGDAKRGLDTNNIVQSDRGDRFIAKKQNGEYKVAPTLINLCFSSDFLLEEADQWRDACWDIIRERKDCTFLFLTKRIERFLACIPSDWEDGYDHVIVCCTVENQATADQRLSMFRRLPIKHKQIVAQPLLEPIDLEPYLEGIEAVVVGGESDKAARVLDYDWVLNIKAQCVRKDVSFYFRQCGTNFLKEGKRYRLHVKDLSKQAKRANIEYVSHKS